MKKKKQSVKICPKFYTVEKFMFITPYLNFDWIVYHNVYDVINIVVFT